MTRLTAGAVLICAAMVMAGSAVGAGRSDEKAGESGQVKIVKKVAPAYPEEAKKEKIQGAVVLEVTIGVDGKVLAAKASKSPDERLAKAAIEAVKQWEFEPTRDGKGKALQVKSSITVNFRLQ